MTEQDKQLNYLKDVEKYKSRLTQIMIDSNIPRDTVKSYLDGVTDIYLRAFELGGITDLHMRAPELGRESINEIKD